MIMNYKNAKDKLLASDISGCLQFFKSNGYILEAAYCELLNDNLDEALILFKSISDFDTRAGWGVFICKLISGNADKYPTYLQLRNFLEIDLDILIKHFKGDYVQTILKYADWMCRINPEVHKFIGRVLINNGIEEYGRMYLMAAKEYFFHDPELHYMLAVEFLKQKDVKSAIDSLHTCLKVLPGYFPAINMLRNLNLN